MVVSATKAGTKTHLGKYLITCYSKPFITLFEGSFRMKLGFSTTGLFRKTSADW